MTSIDFQTWLPDLTKAQVAIEAPGSSTGHWAGGPSAVLDDDGTVILAYRLRRPVGSGRGFANVIARSADGINFETLCTLERDSFAGESLERPWIVRVNPNTWRVYVSVATPGTKHWKVVAIDADKPSNFRAENAVVTMPGDENWGVKDPVIQFKDGMWHAWICYHPLERPEDADRMETRYATSKDGINWNVHGTAISGRAGKWDERGARIGDVAYLENKLLAYYDGCESAAQDTEELLGLAIGDSPNDFASISDAPVVQSGGTGSIRYVNVLPFKDGSTRLYFEAARDDGAHDLYTQLIRP